MIQKPEEFDSAFRYIVVVSQRAEQIINGAKPRGESRHVKPTLIARDDVDQGLVAWRILTQEELDAQRQAIVEQFRAEVGGEMAAEPARRIPDVLPTAVPFSSLDDDEAYEPDQDDVVDLGDEEGDEEAEEDEVDAIEDLDEIEDEIPLDDEPEVLDDEDDDE
jgi:DNA-directed RNA polymerase subunit K/omega